MYKKNLIKMLMCMLFVQGRFLKNVTSITTKGIILSGIHIKGIAINLFYPQT